MSKSWRLYILGSRGTFPVCGERYREFGGATSCYVLKRGSHAIIIDCGSGLNDAGEILSDCSRIDVLLTHVHYDHLMGLLRWQVFPKGAELNFYAQFDAWFGVETFTRFMSPPFWPYTPEFDHLLHPVEEFGRVQLPDGVQVEFCPSRHAAGASILRINTEEGDICVTFDYEHTASFPEHMAKDCLILLYDSTFTRAEYEEHRGWGHSCWEEGCALAQRLQVQYLYVTHHAPDKTDEQLRAQEQLARQTFSGAHFARSGEVFCFSDRRILRPALAMAAAE